MRPPVPPEVALWAFFEEHTATAATWAATWAAAWREGGYGCTGGRRPASRPSLSAAASRLTTGSSWADVLCQQTGGKIPGSASRSAPCR
jgi:hypothetical protein